MALTLQVSLDETIGQRGFSNAEVRDFVSMTAELPDLRDLAMGTWEECSGPSRFKEEAAQEARGPASESFLYVLWWVWGGSPHPM